MRVHLVVEHEFVVAQVQSRKQRILVEQEVGDGGAPEQVELVEPTDLVDPLEQEIELRRQREARHVRIEPREKRICFRRFEQRIGVEIIG